MVETCIGSLTPQTVLLMEDPAKAPSQREGEQQPGYAWADPITYPLLKEFAINHRCNPTPAEDVLWNILKSKKLERYKFRRQHIIGNYIADLVCLDRDLIIEIDGLQHQLPDNKVSDDERTPLLNMKGFKVIRFQNEEVLNKTEQDLNTILSTRRNQPGIKESNDLSPSAAAEIGGHGRNSFIFERRLDLVNK